LPRAGLRSGPKTDPEVCLKKRGGVIGLLRSPARGKPAHHNKSGHHRYHSQKRKTAPEGAVLLTASR